MIDGDLGAWSVVLDDQDDRVDWTYVVLPRRTGITYRWQAGGTACLQAALEGALVPAHDPMAYAALTELFVSLLEGAGALPRGDEELVRLLEAAVALVPVTLASTATGSTTRCVLDRARLTQVAEAHVPVLTAAGPGVLAWPNSD